ncbi:MAG: Thiol peroxidaseBcp-type [Bacillales bacterium]|jgi:peroxiredoxin Q/BCP|nr:Thiol peroxidaseBcp-type [Bacillales bacterium]
MELATDFSLLSSKGENVSLSDYKGKKVVLYFYPKDMTPGCTTEACDFRDRHDEFAGLNTVIIGVSTDPMAKHDKFIQKYGLPFVLLSDEDHRVCELYGVWVLKKNYGKEYMGIERTTFLINEEGFIEKVWKKVKVKNHIEEVLNYIKGL